jgi:acyl dehydratase
MTTAINYDSLNVGDAMPTFITEPITRTHMVRYAGASGDFNPLHYDETFVKTCGMPMVIVHGMLMMGIAGRAVTGWVADKYIRKFGVRFHGMTEPVDLHDFENTKQRATITITGKVMEKFDEAGEKRIRFDIRAINGLGSVKLTGTVVAALP